MIPAPNVVAVQAAQAKWSIPASDGRYVASDLTGQMFGRLVVMERIGTRNTYALWRCLCECGTPCEVSSGKLRDGSTKSCGCLRRENGLRRLAKSRGTSNFRHGHAAGALPNHATPEYISWRQAKQRCSNPKATSYDSYGGRGISMCARWFEDFRAFLADMGPRPPGTSIERIDNDGDYEPTNCRWASAKEQRANQRQRAYECP